MINKNLISAFDRVKSILKKLAKPVEPAKENVAASQTHHRNDLACDLLIFVATSSEKIELKRAAWDFGIKFEKRTSKSPKGEKLSYFFLGKIGDHRVNAVRTELGPLGFNGSASKAIYYRNATGATGIVQLGMAFGINKTLQGLGDVLVSSSIIPYDMYSIRFVEGTAVVYPRIILSEVTSSHCLIHFQSSRS